MSLVRWFRKNNRKVMAVVVIVLMFGFVGGSYLQHLSKQTAGADEDARVVYGPDGQYKITLSDLNQARQKLGILRNLQAPNLLRSITLPITSGPDLNALFLAELLFPDRSTSPVVNQKVKQLIAQSRFRISNDQVDEIFTHLGQDEEVSWLLLTNEIKQLGFKISNASAQRELAGNIPQLFGGYGYKDVIGSMIENQGVTEEQILATFAELLAIYRYATVTCSNEDITTSQIKHTLNNQLGSLRLESVQLAAASFSETLPTPGDEELTGHFEKYKAFAPGSITEDNPYGFGYKLPDRIKLEYIVLKLSDVRDIVTKPTAEEAEYYYAKNRDSYTESILSDPDDPNSDKVERLKTYAEVSSQIQNALYAKKVNDRAKNILVDAEKQLNFEIEKQNADITTLSSKELKSLAGDYKKVADKIAEDYKVKVYTAKTDYVTASDMQMDRNVSMLYVEGKGRMQIGLTKIAFAVEPVKATKLGPFEIPTPKLYENIGPMNHRFGTIAALVRVVEAEISSVPADMNQKFARKVFVLDEAKPEDIYTAKETVTEDIKNVKAMDVAKTKADVLVELVKSDGWDNGLNKFKELNPVEEDANDVEIDKFQLQEFTNLRKQTNLDVLTYSAQIKDNPLAQQILNSQAKSGKFVDQLHSLIPEDANSLKDVPKVLQSKSTMAYYVIKELTAEKVDTDMYAQSKAFAAYSSEFIQSQSLSAVHFNPENIRKRMNVEIPSVQQVSDPNSEAQK